MAFKSNAYNFTDDLKRIGGSLANAMIGNAQDDAAIALANYRDAQTTGQELANRGMRGNLDAIEAAAGGDIMRRSIAQSLGYDVSNGNLIQPVLPGGPQMSVPALGPDQVNMDGEALMTDLGNIARTLFGGGTSTANQVASALDTLGGAGNSRLAESMILRGDNNQAQRGALMMAPQGGQYQNPGFAMDELRTNDATARLDDYLNMLTRSEKNQLESSDRRYNTDAQETTKQNKPIILGLNEIEFDKDGKRIGEASGPTSPEKPIILKDGETAFSADGTEIASVAGGPQIIKLTEGQVAMVEDADSPTGYKEIRGSNNKPPKSIVVSPGQTVVTIGTDGKVIETKTVEDDPITVKANEGQTVQLVVDDPANPGKKKVIYTLEGPPKASSTTTTDSSFSITASDDNAMRDYVALVDKDGVLKNMPNGGLIVDNLIQRAVAAMGSKKNITNAKQFIRKELSQGFTEVVIPDTGTVTSFGRNTRIQVPNFALNKLRDKLVGNDKQAAFDGLKPAAQQQIRGIFTNLGYSDAEVNAIIGAL